MTDKEVRIRIMLGTWFFFMHHHQHLHHHFFKTKTHQKVKNKKH